MPVLVELKKIACDILGISDSTWTRACAVSASLSPAAVIDVLKQLPLTDADNGPPSLPALTDFQADRILRILNGEGIVVRIDDWILRSKLGNGAFGTAYLVYRSDKGLAVLKQMHGGMQHDSSQRRRFQNEFSTLCELDHRGIPSAIQFCDTNPCPYFVMSFIDGINGEDLLKKFVMQDRNCPIITVVTLCKKLCKIFIHVHGRKFVHRDFKPANFLVNADGEVFLVDFGARLHDDPQSTVLTVPNLRIGTPAFLAPEQIRDGHTVDHLADLYSLGCSIFYLLTGHLPFPGTTSEEVYKAHMNAPRPRVDSLRDDVPEWLNRLVFRLMAIDPQNRPRSANEVIATIENAKIPQINIRSTFDENSPHPTVECGIKVESLPDSIDRRLLSMSGRPKFVFHEASDSEMALIPSGVMSVQEIKSDVSFVLSDFYMDLYLVTNAQFQVFVEKMGYHAIGKWQQHFRSNGDRQRPVRDVTWRDAVEYAKWCGKDLPSEAQWIFAATVGGKLAQPWPLGTTGDLRADYGLPKCGEVRVAPPVVGSFLPNEYRIHDLCGAVQQWTRDWFSVMPFGLKPQTVPNHLPNPCFLDQGTARVVRGCAWSAEEDEFSLRLRSSLPPAECSPLVGFRCVWNLTDSICELEPSKSGR